MKDKIVIIVLLINTLLSVSAVAIALRIKNTPPEGYVSVAYEKRLRQWVADENERYENSLTEYVDKNLQVQRDYLDSELDKVYDYLK